MKIEHLLLQKKTEIHEKWIHRLISLYPDNSHAFFASQKNQFNNPIGYTFSNATEQILEILIKEEDLENALSPLDDIIRIQAVQEFTPSKALSFIIDLKQILREELKRECGEHHLEDEWIELETKIDKLILYAFDIYVKCREKIYQLKVRDSKRSVAAILDRVTTK